MSMLMYANTYLTLAYILVPTIKRVHRHAADNLDLHLRSKSLLVYIACNLMTFGLVLTQEAYYLLGWLNYEMIYGFNITQIAATLSLVFFFIPKGWFAQVWSTGQTIRQLYFLSRVDTLTLRLLAPPKVAFTWRDALREPAAIKHQFVAALLHRRSLLLDSPNPRAKCLGTFSDTAARDTSAYSEILARLQGLIPPELFDVDKPITDARLHQRLQAILKQSDQPKESDA